MCLLHRLCLFMPDVDLITSETKRTLLQLMKRRGEIALDDAMEATGYARTTLREHLNQLERDGLVQHRSERQGRGRPSLRYRITEQGERLFPSRDGILLRELLHYLRKQGLEDQIEAFFASFWETRIEEVKHRLRRAGEAGDLDHKLEVLATMLQEEGFMPDIQHVAGRVVIRECNCPFTGAVKQTQLPCKLEEAFYKAVLDETVERVAYMPDGSAACTYVIARDEAE